MLTRGVVLSDRYRLNERIATGGMGAVWKCTDTLLDREVAVKVLLPSLVADPEFTTRFRAEARMMAALRHPGVVQVHDVGSATLTDGSQVSYLVMEYVDGDPLVAWIRRAGRLDPASTMSVVSQAAHALHAAHLAGIVHRDVKPGNLLVKQDGTVVLVDFGIARANTMEGITAAHMVLGTASYMSPEQATGQRVSPATDVYALGAVAYFCLAGRPPFEGDNPLQVALRHTQDEPDPLPPGTPPGVVELVNRALAKSPGDRYPSALAMAEAAQDVREATLASIPVPPRPPWAVAGPAVPGAAELPTPAAPDTPAPAAADRSGATPSGASAPAGSPADPGPGAAPDPRTPVPAPPSGSPAHSTGGQPALPRPAGPAWSVGMAHPGQPGPRPGGYGPEQHRPGDSGGQPTLEEASGRSGRGRVLALAGVAGVVLLALVSTVVVVALRTAGDDGKPQGKPTQAAQIADSTDSTDSTDPLGPEGPMDTESGQPTPEVTGDTPDPVPSGTGQTQQPPSATPGRPAPGATTPAAGASTPPSGGGTTAPKPSSTTKAAEKPNPYTAAQACGSGYQVIDSHNLTVSGVRKGRIYLLYNASNKYNCVVTLKDTDVGKATQMTAFLEVKGKARQTDSGSFSYYAGPKRAAAGAICVKWGGSVPGASYTSPFEHCG